jgi:hypothetical protein
LPIARGNRYIHSKEVNMNKGNGSAEAVPAFLALTRIMLVILSVQFVLGMTANLYVLIPKVHPGAEAGRYFHGILQALGWTLSRLHSALFYHVLTGLLIIGLSIAIFIAGLKSGKTSWIVFSIVGWAMVTGAGFNGLSFVNYGAEYSSMIMACAFLVSAVFYDLVLLTGGRKKP